MLQTFCKTNRRQTFLNALPSTTLCVVRVRCPLADWHSARSSPNHDWIRSRPPSTCLAICRLARDFPAAIDCRLLHLVFILYSIQTSKHYLTMNTWTKWDGWQCVHVWKKETYSKDKGQTAVLICRYFVQRARDSCRLNIVIPSSIQGPVPSL